MVGGLSNRQRMNLAEPHAPPQPVLPAAALSLHPWRTESHFCEGIRLNSLGIMTLKKKSCAVPGDENYKYSHLRKG